MGKLAHNQHKRNSVRMESENIKSLAIKYDSSFYAHDELLVFYTIESYDAPEQQTLFNPPYIEQWFLDWFSPDVELLADYTKEEVELLIIQHYLTAI